jgi:hypothetical protein
LEINEPRQFEHEAWIKCSECGSRKLLGEDGDTL